MLAVRDRLSQIVNGNQRKCEVNNGAGERSGVSTVTPANEPVRRTTLDRFVVIEPIGGWSHRASAIGSGSLGTLVAVHSGQKIMNLLNQPTPYEEEAVR